MIDRTRARAAATAKFSSERPAHHSVHRKRGGTRVGDDDSAVADDIAAALSEDECAGDEVGAASAAVVTRMSKWTSLLDSEYEVAADKALQGAALIGKDVIVQHEGNC